MVGLFYLPFFLIARALLSRFAKEYQNLSLIFTVVLSGLISFLVLYGSIPQFWSWCVLLVASITISYSNIRNSFTAESFSFKLSLPRTLFWILFIFSLFNSINVGPFYPPMACDLSLSHLLLPKIYSENGGWINAWWTRGPFIPQLMHAQFALQMSLLKTLGVRSDITGSTSGLLIFASMIQASRTIISRKNSYWFGIGLLSIGLTRWNLGTAYMDLPSAAMVFAAAIALWISFEKPSIRDGIILGALIASGLGVKHMSLFFVFPLLIVWCAARLIQFRKRESRAQDLKLIISAVLSFGFAFTIIFFENWKLTGNPLYPFFNPSHPEAFRATPTSAKEFLDNIHSFVFDHTLKGAFKAFIEITHDQNRHSEMGAFGIGWVMPCILFAMVVTAWINRSLRILIFALFSIFAFHYFGWYFNAGIVRYLYPSLCLMIFFVVYLVEKTDRKALTGFCLLLLAVTTVQNHFRWTENPPNLPAANQAEVEKFYFDEINAFHSYQWLDQNTPKDSLVYEYGGGDRTLYLPRAWFGDWFGIYNFNTFASGTLDQVKSFIVNNGIDYVFEHQNLPLRKLTSLNLKEICLEEVQEAKDQNLRVLKKLSTPECQTHGTPDPRKSIPFQPKGLDFFFRR